MLVGSVAGGVVAQLSSLAVPYVLRAGMLALTLAAAFLFVRDEGFVPDRSRGAGAEMRRIFRASIDGGLRNPPIRWVMLSAPFTIGVMVYVFYAMQPYLLELYGDETAFAIAGLAAAIVAGAQIAGGLMVPVLRRVFRRRTHALVVTAAVSVAMLVAIGITDRFWIAIVLLVVWALMFSAAMPMRQAYLNGLIPSRQRATVLSFDALMGSAGGVVTQPALGRVADLGGYSVSYVVSAGIQLLAVPFFALARREDASSDPIRLPGSGSAAS
jgi:predicted MFS family arabinose efflux permease